MRPPLQRPRHDRRIAGVCSALARHFGFDPLYARFAVGGLAVVGIFSKGISTGLVVALYLLAWFLLPEEPPREP